MARTVFLYRPDDNIKDLSLAYQSYLDDIGLRVVHHSLYLSLNDVGRDVIKLHDAQRGLHGDGGYGGHGVPAQF